MNGDPLLIAGQAVEAEVDEKAVGTIREAVLAEVASAVRDDPVSPYMTIPEAALYLGCGYKPCRNCGGDACRRCRGTGQVVKRQRVDDLLSSGRLSRVKEGGRTLVVRAEVEKYLTR